VSLSGRLSFYFFFLVADSRRGPPLCRCSDSCSKEELQTKGRDMSKTIQVEVGYQDRSSGPTVAGKVNVEAGSLPVGIGKALREVWKTMDRKVRFDAAKNGMTIKAQVVEAAAASATASDAK
jgi:hypothetical protein